MLKKLKAQGKDPQALKNMPVVPPGFDVLLHHFHRLSRSRTYNMAGPNPIAFSEILSYNQSIARLDLEFFVDVIQTLDEHHMNATQKSSTASKGSPKRAK